MKDARWNVEKECLKHKKSNYIIPWPSLLNPDWVDGFVADKKWLDEVDVEQLKKHQSDFVKKAKKAAGKNQEASDEGNSSETTEESSESPDGEVPEGGSDETQMDAEEGGGQEVSGDAPVSSEECASSV